MGFLTIPTGSRIYFDANIIVYIIEGFQPYRQILDQFLTDIDQGRWIACTSELTIAEVLVKPIREENEFIANTYREFLYNSSTLQIIPIDRTILEYAAQIRATNSSSFKLPDSIHLASAALSECYAFITNDKKITPLNQLSVIQLDSIK